MLVTAGLVLGSGLLFALPWIGEQSEYDPHEDLKRVLRKGIKRPTKGITFSSGEFATIRKYTDFVKALVDHAESDDFSWGKPFNSDPEFFRFRVLRDIAYVLFYYSYEDPDPRIFQYLQKVAKDQQEDVWLRKDVTVYLCCRWYEGMPEFYADVLDNYPRVRGPVVSSLNTVAHSPKPFVEPTKLYTPAPRAAMIRYVNRDIPPGERPNPHAERERELLQALDRATGYSKDESAGKSPTAPRTKEPPAYQDDSDDKRIDKREDDLGSRESTSDSSNPTALVTVMALLLATGTLVLFVVLKKR